MKKKVIAFDLDGTLAPSKSPLPDRMAEQLAALLEYYQVCVISGGKIEQFEKQLLTNLKVGPSQLERLHLMPTCGTRYYRYDAAKTAWEKVYAEDFTAEESKKIKTVVLRVVQSLGYEEKETWGETLEDRGSQITYSALGQDVVDHLGLEGVERKESWDPDNVKKEKIRAQAAELLPEFEVRIGGLTSIDITRPGIDKAYGMRKIMEILAIGQEQIFFIGDRIIPGGNDYPVKEMGIDSLQINRWEETAMVVEALVKTA